MAESKEELKSLLMKVKEESEKAGLKFNIPKSKIMASGSITSWQIEGVKVEKVTDFLFLGSKITADGDCSHEIRRHLLLGRKVMTNLDSTWTFLVAQMVKCLPNARDPGLIPGFGRSLEKEMATHSSILAWKIPWMEEPGRLQSMGLQRVGHD